MYVGLCHECKKNFNNYFALCSCTVFFLLLFFVANKSSQEIHSLPYYQNFLSTEQFLTNVYLW